MKKAGSFGAVFLILTGVAGCGDSPHVLVHDLLVFWNEVCDNMVRATDEATAKELLKVQFTLLDKKYEKYKDRIEKKMRDVTGREEATVLDNALADLYHEYKATVLRLDHCQKHLADLIAKTPDHDSLLKIKQWPDERKKFNDYPFGGSFTPKTSDPEAKFGNGLLMKRPKLK